MILSILQIVFKFSDKPILLTTSEEGELVALAALELDLEALVADHEAVHVHDGGLGGEGVVERDEPEAL